jgi:hypothetical protein
MPPRAGIIPWARTARPRDLRLLRVNALYVMALWLHSPATDLLVPIAPSPIAKEGKPMPPAEFFADLSELASQAIRPA